MTPAAKVSLLVVDDDPYVAETVRELFSRRGYEVRTAGDPESALRLLHKSPPDLVLLDVNMPGMDGLEVLRRIRSAGQVPVIFVSARDTEVDKVVGLKLGADDYVVKPFSPAELAARVEAVLRRPARAAAASAAVFGALEVDFDRCEVRVAGKVASLRPKEFALLRLLIEADGKVLTRADILAKVWGYAPELGMNPRQVDQYVARIRRVLGPERGRIVTVSTAGYRFAARR